MEHIQEKNKEIIVKKKNLTNVFVANNLHKTYEELINKTQESDKYIIEALEILIENFRIKDHTHKTIQQIKTEMQSSKNLIFNKKEYAIKNFEPFFTTE